MSVREFFAGKNVFITGGTGFLGKYLIEKLLRSCPEIKNVYILIRTRKGKSPSERWQEIAKDDVFDNLREMYPENLDKVIPIEGDMCALGLGISGKDRQTLIDNVNLVYHMAASTRFDDSLQYAVFANVRSTREVIALSKEMKNFTMFVHVSTAYSNCDRLDIEEKIYPSHGDWQESIKIVEEANPEVVNSMTLKYIYPHPNTYTYTKSLAEQTVVDMCKGHIPSVIIRPSIVTSAIAEPKKGWGAGMNGPIGLLSAGGKGLLRICLGSKNAYQDYIPVDIVGRLLVLVAYEQSKIRSKDVLEVYNVSQYSPMLLSVDNLISLGKKSIEASPMSRMLWYPRPAYTNSFYNYYIQVILFHMIPALFFDAALKLLGQRSMIYTMQRRIYIANTVLLFFMSRRFNFSNSHTFDLFKNISQKDKEEFGLQPLEEQMGSMQLYFINAKKYIMTKMFKDDFTDIEKNKRRLWRLWVLDIIVKLITGSILFWFFFIKHNIIKYLFNVIANSTVNLYR